MRIIDWWYRKPKIDYPPGWEATAKAWIATHPFCRACGRRTFLQVHHKVPLHVNPRLALDPTNLITLCMFPGVADHFHVGHYGISWFDFNPNVELEADRLLRVRTHAS